MPLFALYCNAHCTARQGQKTLRKKNERSKGLKVPKTQSEKLLNEAWCCWLIPPYLATPMQSQETFIRAPNWVCIPIQRHKNFFKAAAIKEQTEIQTYKYIGAGKKNAPLRPARRGGREKGLKSARKSYSLSQAMIIIYHRSAEATKRLAAKTRFELLKCSDLWPLLDVVAGKKADRGSLLLCI